MASMAQDCGSPVHPGDISKAESEAGILPSHGISLDLPEGSLHDRPPLVTHLSTPSYQSPLRHHRRAASQHREVKETLNARSEYRNSEDDGKAEHSINQYIIKEEIGRGSFGAVHLAVDQYGQEFAVKEFSKSRLRKRAQSHILRRPHDAKRRGNLSAGGGFNAPLHRHSASDIHDVEQRGNPLYLIKEEIAIMKKLNHPNLVQLIEVLDDPEEDSLYMVLEMCKKGVVMKVGLDEKADPYDVESCRCWFRDLILGIEYLHAQGVVHRDIKPDNLLLMEDDALKIVDFGVSEMFEKESDMKTAKSAGSPAFLPPELCVAKHGDISGKAADIWSMGISLYCLRFGHIPFERSGVLELYEAIKNDRIDYTPDDEPEFVDLMNKILEKNPNKRITMRELREHPWVTKNGTDPMMSEEENTANLVEPPTEIEMNHAITSNMTNLMVVMKAVKRFKTLLAKKRPVMMNSVFGKGTQIVHPPLNLDGKDDSNLQKSQSMDLQDRSPIARALVSEGVHVKKDTPEDSQDSLRRMDSAVTITPALYKAQFNDHHRAQHVNENMPPKVSPTTNQRDESSEPSGEKGHAHDPMDEEPRWLGIGTGSEESDHSSRDTEVIAESPTAAGFNIYDTAYQNEVERIRKAQGDEAKVYLTRRVDSKKEYKADENMIEAPTAEDVAGKPHEGWKGLLDAARQKEKTLKREASQKEYSNAGGKGRLKGLASYVSHAGSSAKATGSSAIARGQELFSSATSKTAKKEEAVDTAKGEEVAEEGNGEEKHMSGKGGIALANVLHKAMDKRSEKVDAGETTQKT